MITHQFRSESRFKYLVKTQFRQLQIADINTSSIKVGQSQLTQPSPSPQLRSVVRNQRQWPGKPPSSQLPQNYKQTARRVVMAMVAAPIMIVTSYILYQRIILGRERKHLGIAPDASRSRSG